MAQKETGCLDKLHIQSPSMQMKEWLAQKTLYTNAALLTRSLGKSSITPTQAKKLVTQGIDFHTLLLLRRYQGCLRCLPEAEGSQEQAARREVVQGALLNLEVSAGAPSLHFVVCVY